MKKSYTTSWMKRIPWPKTDGDASNELTCYQFGDVHQVLDVLQLYMLSDNKECIYKCINQIIAVVENKLSVRLMIYKTDIRNFFH